MTWTAEAVAKTIDHSLLRPEATIADLEAGAEIALRYGVASLCAKSCDVTVARALLAGSGVRTSCVIGFPHGGQSTAAKVAEALQAVADGAVELDMVVNVGWLRSGLVEAFRVDIASVVRATTGGAAVKTILEVAYLTTDEKVLACRIAEEAGAAFVKTSTGFGPSGATIADVRLLRSAVGPAMLVKASGGIRSAIDVVGLLDAGAARIGTSSTETILAELSNG